MCNVDWVLLTGFLVGIGTVMMGFGALMAGYAGWKNIPKFIEAKEAEIVLDEATLNRWRKFVRSCIGKLEAEDITMNGRTRLPENLDNLSQKISQEFPVLGTPDNVKKYITDLMKNNMIQWTSNPNDGPPVIKTVRWDVDLNRTVHEEIIRDDGTRGNPPPAPK